MVQLEKLAREAEEASSLATLCDSAIAEFRKAESVLKLIHVVFDDLPDMARGWYNFEFRMAPFERTSLLPTPINVYSPLPCSL
jgi:hypothetical protein